LFKFNFKKFLVAVTAAFCVAGNSSVIYGNTVDMNLVYDGANHAYSAEEVTIKVNGDKITNMDVPPVIIDSRTLVPVRAIFEKMGAEVTWNASTQQVYIVKNNDIVDLKIDSNTGHTNGLDFKMDTSAKIINDRTMIPVRAASEALGCTVGWDDATRLITINEKGYSNPVIEVPTNSSNGNSTTTTATTPKDNDIQLTGVNVPSSTSDKEIFTIKASGVIEKYNSFLLGENRIVVDVYNADMGIANTNITTTNSTTVKSIRSAQNQVEPVKISRVVLDLTATVNYNVSLSSDKKSILVTLETNKNTSTDGSSGSGSTAVDTEKSTLNNLTYDSATNTIVLKNLNGLKENDFSTTDNYLLGNYKVTLDGDYHNTYGYGIISVNNSLVSNITVQNTTSGNTQFVINENAIVATKIYVTDAEIRIKIMSPRDVYSKIVVIDSGHGKTDPGASGNGLIEKELNLEIALRVYDLFESNNNIKVYLTRANDSYPTNVNRAKMANSIADLFISIHINSSTSSVPSGTETLYTVHSTDVSGKLTSQIAAEYLEDYLVKALQTTDRGIKNRSDLIVLNQTTVPAALVEIGFISNAADAEKLSKDSYKDIAANAIYSAIVDMMNNYSVR
jgi:N-acetylmuramoyl-L-alanine amidase